MKPSRNSARRIVYADVGVVDDTQRLYHAGLIVAYSLLLSNSIRRDTKVVLDLVYRGVETRLIVNGAKVRGLRLDYSSLAGFMKAALRGKLRGVDIVKPVPLELRLCLQPGYNGLADAVCRLYCTLRADRVALVLASSEIVRCRRIVNITSLSDEQPPWLKAALLQLLLDWWFTG